MNIHITEQNLQANKLFNAGLIVLSDEYSYHLYLICKHFNEVHKSSVTVCYYAIIIGT